jgi:hypothetical protein
MTSVAIELRMARVFQAELGILSRFLTSEEDDEFSVVDPIESNVLLFILSLAFFVVFLMSSIFSHHCV